MERLKLVIVDDEPILLKGLIETYDWHEMGFEIVGSAMSGEQAIEVIKEKRPHVVLTDIRMKQITGLMVIEEIQKTDIGCLFVVLSAYRDFEYAKQACELGAHAYLLKPIEDDKLKETMLGAHECCMKQIQTEEKYESWEKLLKKDSTNFLQVIVQKHVLNRIPLEKVEEVFATLGDVVNGRDKFITVCVDIDLVYKITNALDYEASRCAVIEQLEEAIGETYFYWKVETEDGNTAFIIKTEKNETVHELKRLLERVKKEDGRDVVAAISKPYLGLKGITRSFDEARTLFDIASASGASAFTIPGELEEKSGQSDMSEAVMMIVNAVRKNAREELKEAFVYFIYHLPKEEEKQCSYIHKVMLQSEVMVKESYGMTEKLLEKFQSYYANLTVLSASRAVDVCYKILKEAIEIRKERASTDETKYFKEYMSVAVAYIEEHLDDENLSIVSVATHIYLNPVYFGRVFKNTFQMTFKKYLLQQRMEKAKRLLEEGTVSIGTICEQVGISNPSYFSHLFKQYTGKLPSEYKKEYEV